MEPMISDEWVPLRVLVLNSHVGILLRTALPWLLDRDHYHVALISEAGSPLARARLRLRFPLTAWRLVGVRPPSTGPGSSGTIIATRRSRLRHVSHSNRLLTSQRTVDGKRDKWHPERRLTRGVYRDRRTGQTLALIAMHLWHIKGGPREVTAEHDRQAGMYALAVREAHSLLQLVIAGGDVNEARERGVVREAVGEQRMRTVSWDHIDALFVSSAVDLRVQSVEHIDLTRFPGGEAAHAAISAVVLVRKLPAP